MACELNLKRKKLKEWGLFSLENKRLGIGGGEEEPYSNHTLSLSKSCLDGLISSQGCTLTEQEAMGISCLRGILYEDKCFTVGTIMFPRNVSEPVLPEKFKTQPDNALEWCPGKPNLKLSFDRRLNQVSSGSLFQPRFFYSSMILQ